MNYSQDVLDMNRWEVYISHPQNYCLFGVNLILDHLLDFFPKKPQTQNMVTLPYTGCPNLYDDTPSSFTFIKFLVKRHKVDFLIIYMEKPLRWT